jgi:hypothetical protein
MMMGGALGGSTSRYCNALNLLPTKNALSEHVPSEVEVWILKLKNNYFKSPVVLFGVAKADVSRNVKCAVVPVT